MANADDRSPVRRARVLMLLEAAEYAGLTPIPVVELHTLAYFANVLSPIWDLLPQTRTVVRKQGGPYYPELQSDVDALVGRGFVGLEALKHRKDYDGRWRLEGRFFLVKAKVAQEISGALQKFDDERKLFAFYRELAFAFAEIPKKYRALAVNEDAIYSLDVGDEVIVDFAEWKQANYSENAARYFDSVMPDGRTTTAAQKLHLYTLHLKRRLAEFA